jgi:hypothetical protein
MWWRRRSGEGPLVSEEEIVKLLRTVDERPYSSYSNIAKIMPMIGYLLVRETRRLTATADTLLWVTVLLFLATLVLIWNAVLLLGRSH